MSSYIALVCDDPQDHPESAIPGSLKADPSAVGSQLGEAVNAGRGGKGDAASNNSPTPSAQGALIDAHIVYQRWFGDNYDPDIFNAVLAAHASSYLKGDPLWLMVVGGSGFGKTETLMSLVAAGAHVVSTIHSEGALLSATTGEGAKGKTATGGILRKIGKVGVLILKDFTTILSMPDRTSKPMILAALREIYDGHWVRNVGSDGGQELEWKGHLTVIAGCTTAWDTAHTTIAAMGDRFAVIRGNSRVLKDRVSAGRQAMQNAGSEARMRNELQVASKRVIDAASKGLIQISTEDQEQILAVANIVSMARSAVDFDYRGKVEYAHDPESPTRLVKELIQLMRGAIAIGLDRAGALALSMRSARDSMPPIRLACLLDVAKHPESKVQQVSNRVQRPWNAVDKALQALHSHGLLICTPQEATHNGKTQVTWYYRLADGVDVRPFGPQ